MYSKPSPPNYDFRWAGIPKLTITHEHDVDTDV